MVILFQNALIEGLRGLHNDFRGQNGAGDRDRTGIYSLEGCRSTIELRPRSIEI